MDKEHLFIITHLGSNFSYLDTLLNGNPRVAATHTGFVYTYPLQLKLLNQHFEQLNNVNQFRRIYSDSLVQNHAFACKEMYKLCKFIYFVRPAEPTLSELMAEKTLGPMEADSYYCFRLQRMSEMAKHTPNALLITWNDLATKKAYPLIENYLGLKMPLDNRGKELERSIYYQAPQELVRHADRAYDRYVARIRKCLNRYADVS